jgi:hypothetical protein
MFAQKNLAIRLQAVARLLHEHGRSGSRSLIKRLVSFRRECVNAWMIPVKTSVRRSLPSTGRNHVSRASD